MLSVHTMASPAVTNATADLEPVGHSALHVHLVHPASTCLRSLGEPWTFRGTTNLGLCRMPKDHAGRCADEVKTCDGCDETVPAEDAEDWASNEDVQFCGRCV